MSELVAGICGAAAGGILTLAGICLKDRLDGKREKRAHRRENADKQNERLKKLYVDILTVADTFLLPMNMAALLRASDCAMPLQSEIQLLAPERTAREVIALLPAITRRVSELVQSGGVLSIDGPMLDPQTMRQLGEEFGQRLSLLREHMKEDMSSDAI